MGKQFCGGTIIDAKTIVTAAHCFHDSKGVLDDFAMNNLWIAIGQQRLPTFSWNTNYFFRIPRDNIYIHESYNVGLQFSNDITIIKTTYDMPMERGVVDNACLATADMRWEGADCWVAGWGNTIG